MMTSPSPVERLIKPVKSRLRLACALQALGAAAGVAPFIIVAQLGRVLLDESTVDAQRAWSIAAIAIVALALRLLCQMAAAALTHLADLDLQLHLRRAMAQRLSRVALGWFDNRSAGAVKKSLQDDVAALHHLVGHAYTDRVSAIVTPLVALAYLISISWQMALAALAPIALGLALYALQFRGYGDKMAAYNSALADVNAAAVEFVQGIAVVKTFGQARKAYSRFVERSTAFIGSFWTWMRGVLGVSAASEFVLSPLFCLFVVTVIGVVLIDSGQLQAIDILPAVILTPALSAPLKTLSYAHIDMMQANAAATRIAALLDTPLLPEPLQPKIPDGSCVKFERVCFSYDGQTNVLNDINLTLQPGSVTALVGPSGSGKSTLVRLLPRYWDVTAGRITIGGVPITEIAPKNLYRLVSFVFQNVQLLRASVADNIALGRPQATKAEIEAAAKAAQIHQRISALPRGYDSIVWQDACLSGGEAQRLSIARALLADAPVLVLDEATAFADPESEAAIQDALAHLVAGRTLLILAHRLHTISTADQICVMDKGRIVERGQHDQLLSDNGLYAQLWAASEGLSAEAVK